ncbi:dTMP kinase [Streptomyces sp. BI20]|uniref:dTMP kinase n=1 Tax=Streptomyces sp. BI20 TaxID=3403460 RepID=UPI003C71ABAC
MTRTEQPTAVTPTYDEALAADSRERAVRALLRTPRLRRLWSAQVVSGVGDALALLVLVLLSLQAAVDTAAFGGGYRGVALVVATVFAVRALAVLLSGAVLLGPLAALLAPGGKVDRRWTMIGADGVRLALFVVAPLWLDWLPDHALIPLLASVFVAGIAERLWTIAKDSAAPALLPAPPPEGDAVRPLPDHLDALRRLNLRTNFAALPVAAAVLLLSVLVGKALGLGVDWFAENHTALGSYVAAGLFAAGISLLLPLVLPETDTPRPRSPLEGLRPPKAGDRPDKGRTGAVPLLVLACAAVTGAIASAVAVAVLHAFDLGGGPAAFALLVLALLGGVGGGIAAARGGRVLPGLSRRRLFALAIAVSGVALLLTGLVPDTATVIMLSFVAGLAAGVAANIGHALLDQESEEARRPRTTAHLQAAARVAMVLGGVLAPLVAGGIGPHRFGAADGRVGPGEIVFAHGGAAYALMLVGALLLPVAAMVITKGDDRSGVPLGRDLREALRGGEPAQAASATGFFIALEGGDGAGKSTQVKALSEWIRSKGHEVVVTREPGATPIGKRLRSILLDVSSAGLSNRAEALLYAADRAEHVDTVVRPALERGAVVITDRYIDSSVAYQGAGRDLSPTEIARISRWATTGLVPHLTVLLDVSPEAARERFTEAPDRLESEPAEFHERVRAGFLTLAAADPGRYLVVDAGQDPETVATAVRHRLDRILPMSADEIAAQVEARRKAVEEARLAAEAEAARKAEEERRRLEAEAQARAEAEAARKAAEEARLAAEAEAARKAEEERRRLEAEAQARAEAEAARKAAEEARLAAEAEAARKAEAARREAEEKARAAEAERLRLKAEEEARERAEAEARRLEKQRKAEAALLRAEEARRLAEASAAKARAESEARARAEERERARIEAEQRRAREEREAREAREAAARLDDAVTVETPIVVPDRRVVHPDDITQTVPVPTVDPARGAEDETRVLPRIGPGTGPGSDDATRELPVLDDRGRPVRGGGRGPEGDPSLADELFGGGGSGADHEDEGPARGGRRRR